MLNVVPEAREFYREFASLREKEISSGEANLRRLSILRLFVFGGMALSAFFCFEPDPFQWKWMAFFCPLLVVFGFLVRLYEKHHHQVEHQRQALYSATEGIGSIDLDWETLPNSIPYDLKGQDAVIARDLSLTGARSLFHRISRKGWEKGSRVLLNWAFSPISKEESHLRQINVSAWSNHPQALLQWQAHARRRPSADLDADKQLLDWAESTAESTRFFLPLCLIILNVLAWSVLTMTGNSSILLLQLLVNWGTCRHRSRKFDPRILLQEGRIISLLDSGRHLLATPLFPKGDGPTIALKEDQDNLETLFRRLSWTQVFRSEMMHQILQVLTFWDTWVLPLLDQWRKQHGQSLRGCLERRAMEEAIATLSLWQFEHPTFCWSESIEHGKSLTAKAMGHPLLGEDHAVTNDLILEHGCPLLVLGGSNMSGKSTLLRALGLNLLMARMGAVVFARDFTIPPLELRTSFRLEDSLSQGLSFFMSELQQLKEVNMTQKNLSKDKTLLFLFDEILLGTNLQERREAIGRVLEHLLNNGALGALATHDLDSLDRPGLKDRLAMFHMGEGVLNTKGQTLPSFDYKLKKGACSTGNALILLEHSGALD